MAELDELDQESMVESMTALPPISRLSVADAAAPQPTRAAPQAQAVSVGGGGGPSEDDSLRALAADMAM
jgi:hypothetical protein